jgi:hypothetical protein
MTLIAFALVLTGVLLNAAAQLFLKAGTNAIGHFDFALANIIPIGLKIAGQPFDHRRPGLLRGQRGGVDHGPVASAGEHRLSDAVDRLRDQRADRPLLVRRAAGDAKALGIGFIIIGVILVANS